MKWFATCFIFVSTFAGIGAFANSNGGAATGGGDVIIAKQQGDIVGHLYSLDLMEYDLQKNVNMYGNATLENNFPKEIQTPIDGFQLFKIPVPFGCTAAYYWLYDTSARQATKIIHDSGLWVDPALDQWCEPYRIEIGLANLIYRIRLKSPDYADRILKRIGDTTWIFVDVPLQDIKDENTPISTQCLYQMARNDDGEVRITKSGWFQDHKLREECVYTGEKVGDVVGRLSYTNKMALILHEVLYSITREQGDTNSRRARRANALLFTENMDDIQKSFRIIFSKDGQEP